MNYNNIIYIDDEKLYFLKKDQIIFYRFSKDIIYKLDKKIFIKEYISFLKKERIKIIFFNKKITIVYSSKLSIHDINYLRNLFYEIGYNEVILIKDLSLIKLSKKNAYLLTGNIDTLFYVDDYNRKQILFLDNNNLKSDEEMFLIKNRVHNNLFIVGNKQISIFENYYFIEDKAKFFIELALSQNQEKSRE